MPKPTETPPVVADTRERRLFRRIGTRIEGRIVFAGVDVECVVHDMSATGALVECLPLPALGVEVALDVPDVGFARGVAIRHDGDFVCVELATSPVKRHRLADKLILAAFHFPPDT